MHVNGLIERKVEVFRQYEEECGISVFGLDESVGEKKRRTEEKSRIEIRENFYSSQRITRAVSMHLLDQILF